MGLAGSQFLAKKLASLSGVPKVKINGGKQTRPG